MFYGTIADFRLAFASGEDDEDDEFITRTDAYLEEALESASAEIDSYLPRTQLSAQAILIVTRKCYLLARLFVYKDQALDQTHPVIREAENVRKWLRYLSQGTVTLPGDDLAKKVGGIAGGERLLPEIGHLSKFI